VAKKVQSGKTGKRTVRRSRTSGAKKAPNPPVKEAPQAIETEVKTKRLRKSPLSKAELKEFRQMLLDKRRTILGDMSGMDEAVRTNRQEGTGDLSKIPEHYADVGSDNFEQEFTLGLLESERVLLAEINEALERIDKGTYGVCLGTGRPIDEARLRARPWAKYCIEYAHMLEKGLVRPRPGREEFFHLPLEGQEEEAEELEEPEAEAENVQEEDKPAED
jgi:RNA polymerase-binding protein DksA